MFVAENKNHSQSNSVAFVCMCIYWRVETTFWRSRHSQTLSGQFQHHSQTKKDSWLEKVWNSCFWRWYVSIVWCFVSDKFHYRTIQGKYSVSNINRIKVALFYLLMLLFYALLFCEMISYGILILYQSVWLCGYVVGESTAVYKWVKDYPSM